MNRTHRRWQSATVALAAEADLSQDLSAVFLARRRKGSHQEHFTDLHGNKTDPPCHRRGRGRAEPRFSQLQASATPRQSPRSSRITHCIKSPFQMGFGSFPGYFSCTRTGFWGAPEDYRHPKPSCLRPRCKSGVPQLELQRSRD